MNSRILVGFRATEDTPKKPEQGNRKNSAQQRPRSGHSVILQHLSKWALFPLSPRWERTAANPKRA
jgi:hypothetical protein